MTVYYAFFSTSLLTPDFPYRRHGHKKLFSVDPYSLERCLFLPARTTEWCEQAAPIFQDLVFRTFAAMFFSCFSCYTIFGPEAFGCIALYLKCNWIKHSKRFHHSPGLYGCSWVPEQSGRCFSAPIPPTNPVFSEQSTGCSIHSDKKQVDLFPLNFNSYRRFLLLIRTQQR